MNAAWVENTIRRFRAAGALVDTNLLLVYLVGRVEPLFIKKFKRTAIYSPSDFEFLTHFIGVVPTVWTTAGIASEVGNFAAQFKGDAGVAVRNAFREFLVQAEESTVRCREVAAFPEFAKFGFTDATVCEVARNGALVLTDDFALANQLESQDLGVLGYHHVRQAMRS